MASLATIMLDLFLCFPLNLERAKESRKVFLLMVVISFGIMVLRYKNNQIIFLDSTEFSKIHKFISLILTVKTEVAFYHLPQILLCFSQTRLSLIIDPATVAAFTAAV